MSDRRLESVDIWKGVTILSVLVIHTCFYSGRLYLPDWTRRVTLLLDVPVFFFISGFLLQNRVTKTVFRRTWHQGVRLVFDYLVISIAILFAGIILYHALNLESGVDHELAQAFTSLLKFDPVDSVWDVFPVYGGSMWYLRVYLGVLLVGSLILLSPLKRILYLVTIIVYGAFLVTVNFPQADIPFLLTDMRHLTFYLAIFLAGAAFDVYRKQISIGGLSMVWAVLILASLVVVFQTGGLPELQEAKFSPTSLYLLFSSHSILAFCMLLLYETRHAFVKPTHPLGIFTSWCGRHSYRIYLWQGMVASIPFLFVPALLERGVPPLVIFLISLTWTVSVSAAITYGHNWLMSANSLVRKMNDWIEQD